MTRIQEKALARSSEAAVALIRHQPGTETFWLSRWNEKWSAFHFVSGHKRANESFRQCLLREIGEELGLREGADYDSAAQPAAHVKFTAFSRSAGVDTEYIMELFDVALYLDVALPAITVDPVNRWLSEAEIRAERTHDGRPVSETMTRLIEEIAREA